MAAILGACNCKDGINKTKLVYQANLNFKTAEPYLTLLIEKGLLNIYQGASTLYKTTDDGKVLLDKFKKIQNYLNES